MSRDGDGHLCLQGCTLGGRIDGISDGRDGAVMTVLLFLPGVER